MTAWDWLIVALYLSAVVGVAGWASRRGTGAGAYFLAGRTMPAWAVGLSVMATAFSAINYVALPTEVAQHGLYVLGSLPAFVLVTPFITRLVIPFFRDLQLVSAYGYLEHRFSPAVRRFAAVVFLLWRWLWLSAALLALAAVASHVAQMPVGATILVAGLLATAYTSFGGLRAVMWTDSLQFAVILASIVLVTLIAARHVPGGAAEIVATAHRDGLLRPLTPWDPAFLSLDPRHRITLPSAIIGTLVVFLGRYGADQVMLQRYFAARSLATARRGMWLNVAAALLALTLLACFGLVVHAVVAHGIVQPQPPQPGTIAMGRLLGAVIHSLPAGVTGLVLAGLAAATLSSLDSGINACAASYLHDLHQRPNFEQPWLRRTVSATCGLATIAGAGLLALLGQDLFTLANRIVNALGSPLLALFIVGMFTRRANSTGVLVGGVVGLIVSIAISIGVSELALHYYAAGNLLVTVLACLIASHIAQLRGHGNRPEQLQWTWQGRRAQPAPASAPGR